MPESLNALIPGFSPPPDGRVRGVVVAGLDDPGFLDRLLRALPRLADGYETPVYVIDPRAPLSDAVRSTERFRVFAGPDGIERFLADRRSVIGLSLPRYVTSASAAGGPLMLKLRAGLDALAAQQAALDGVLRVRLTQRSASRGTAHWHARYGAIGRGASPARVLVLTSRYSTFVRHSAEDLAIALRGAGHDARVIMEPDAHSTLTSCFYLDEIDRFDPDLIVGINYPRAALGNALPEGWPYLCWVQDAMVHLFTTTARATPLDFVAGHVYPGAVARQGYDASRVMEHAVPVSGAKFHPGPAHTTHEKRFATDIAYVSHRSETPEAFHDRFRRDSGMSAGPAADALEACRGRVAGIVGRWATQASGAELPRAAEELARGFGRAGDAAVVDVLLHQYVRPLCEQMLRHETLHWAAGIAKERGLTLAIYGKGWDTHPTLAEFARGPLAHDEELRACYHSAACHLHASALGVGHQRVYECAMSGGVTLCRRSLEEMYYEDWARSRKFVTAGIPPDEWHDQPRWPLHVVANHPALMHLVRDRQRIGPKPRGWDHEKLGGRYGHIAVPGYTPYDGPIKPDHMRAYTILGDFIETTFSSRAELEQRIQFAAERGSWREQVASGIGRRAREAVSMELFASRMLRMVSAAMAPASELAGEAA